MTHCIRILRLYVQEPNPSAGLVKMVNFIIKWYAVMYFNILMRPNVIYAAKHFFHAIGKKYAFKNMLLILAAFELDKLYNFMTFLLQN